MKIPAHPLLNRSVEVTWAEPTPKRPKTLYVAYIDSSFIRFVDNNDWKDATYDVWVATSEVVQMRVK